MGRMAMATAAVGAMMTTTGGATQTSSTEAATVVGEVRKLIAEHYVLPEKRPALEAALAAGLAAGRYDGVEPAQLAERINGDMAAAAHDKHLGLAFAPDRASSMEGRQGDDETIGPMWERMAQVRNHGFSEMRVLPGNVRYVALDGFVWTGPKTAAAYDHAARFLREGDAIVIDLRRNGGGNPRAVQYLASHFVKAGQPLVTFHMGGGRTDRVVADGELPAGRLTGKPLYVLTSSRSASAAEEFAGHVTGFRLGELIGETTAGAAFRNDFFAVAGKYVLSVSVGRPELAATGGDWEGSGISPTIRAEPAKALDVAHLHAVRKLAERAPQHEKGQLEALAARLAGGDAAGAQ